MALHKQKQVEQGQASFVMLSRAYRLWLIHYLVWQLGTLGRKSQVMMREPHRKFVIEESKHSLALWCGQLVETEHFACSLEPRLGWRGSGPVPGADF